MFFILFGFISWIILEYLTHRFILHRLPMNATHHYHHENPHDKNNFIISIFVSIPVLTIYCIITYFLFGSKGMILSFSTFFIGYIIYEIIHYSVHYRKLKSPILKYLRKHHLRHHSNKYANKNYGVTSPIMDYIFRTKE